MYLIKRKKVFGKGYTNSFHTFFISAVLFVVMILAGESSRGQISWSVQQLVENGRIDAVADLGNGVTVAGSRWPDPGRIFRSEDYGVTWKEVKRLDQPANTFQNNSILGIMSGPDGLAYLVTSNAQFWRSTDRGMTWKRTADLDAVMGIPSFSYSICVTPKRTVLVTRGFSVYRSIDNGLHFKQIGPITDNYLYRLQLVRQCIIANGWDGRLFISMDDGLTWKSFAKLGHATYPLQMRKPYDPMKSQPYLTAIESLGDNLFIQGSMNGENYIIDRRHPDQVRYVSKFEGSLDDYVYLGYNTIIASTFLGEKNNYISFDSGKSWNNLGRVNTGQDGDWLDHVICLKKKDSVIALGGTSKGFMIRSSFSVRQLKEREAQDVSGTGFKSMSHIETEISGREISEIANRKTDIQ